MKTGKMLLEIALKGIPPTKNNYDSMHWAEQQQVHDRWAWETKAAVLRQRKWNHGVATHAPYKLNVPVKALVRFWVPDRRVRDVENFVIHGILDGLVAADVLRDDRWVYLPAVEKAVEGIGEEGEAATLLQLFAIEAD